MRWITKSVDYLRMCSSSFFDAVRSEFLRSRRRAWETCEEIDMRDFFREERSRTEKASRQTPRTCLTRSKKLDTRLITIDENAKAAVDFEAWMSRKKKFHNSSDMKRWKRINTDSMSKSARMIALEWGGDEDNQKSVDYLRMRSSSFFWPSATWIPEITCEENSMIDLLRRKRVRTEKANRQTPRTSLLRQKSWIRGLPSLTRTQRQDNRLETWMSRKKKFHNSSDRGGKRINTGSLSENAGVVILEWGEDNPKSVSYLRTCSSSSFNLVRPGSLRQRAKKPAEGSVTCSTRQRNWTRGLPQLARTQTPESRSRGVDVKEKKVPQKLRHKTMKKDNTGSVSKNAGMIVLDWGEDNFKVPELSKNVLFQFLDVVRPGFLRPGAKKRTKKSPWQIYFEGNVVGRRKQAVSHLTRVW